MSSYAEKFQAAKERNAHAQTVLSSFEDKYSFPLDKFQLDACAAVEAGRGVLVAAPTGAGKTIVGEFSIYLALTQGKKAFYTTPIKALSNQKYHDLVREYGKDAVGLLTGDTSINSEAPIVVMTTEVLRNMIYAKSSTLLNLGYVVMDEVHYLADRSRGAVWEEIIIHLPEHISLISLSATISNAEEFGAWLDTVRGKTDIIVSEHRPVPLWQHVMVGRNLVDLFVDETTVEETAELLDGSLETVPEVNPELLALRGAERRRSRHETDRFTRSSRGKRRRKSPMHSRAFDRKTEYTSSAFRPVRASRPDMIYSLDRAALLPAICFIFSRAGCDAAVSQCIDADVRLTTDRESATIRAYIAERTASLDGKDLSVLGFYEWREGLTRGIASHHAGLLTVFKEIVEALFAEGLIKVVFATETLALGINMPARSVVLEKLTKFNGENHVDITPGEYTQLTGRAGRRGIDIEGHAIVLWKPGLEPMQVAGLASKRTYPLNSSFRPTYNMSSNLIAQYGLERAKKNLEYSFAQFQADKSVVGIAQRVRKNERALHGYEESMCCHLGDFNEYSALRRSLTELEKKAQKSARKRDFSQAISSMHRLLPGDVVEIPRGRNKGFAVVLTRAESHEHPSVSVITEEAQLRRIEVRDLDGPLIPLSKVKVAKKYQGKTPKERRDMVSRMRTALYENRPPREQAQQRWFNTADSPVEQEISRIRQQLRTHPCHGCSDRENHARWAERWWKLEKDTQGLRRQINRRTNTISQVFERIVRLLAEYDYVAEDDRNDFYLTDRGQSLRRIYGEKDFLLSLCLEDNFLNGLDPAATAATVSAIVFEAKRDSTEILAKYPRKNMEEALMVLTRTWVQLTANEEQYKLSQTPPLDFGLVWPTYKWARGETLAKSLDGTGLAAGDFVRWIKQVIDVLDQITHVAEDDSHIRTQCERAINLLRRGVVASSL